MSTQKGKRGEWENGAMNQFEIWKRPSTPPSFHWTTLSLALRVSTAPTDDLVGVDITRRPHSIPSLELWSSNLRVSSPHPSSRSFPYSLTALRAREGGVVRRASSDVLSNFVTGPRRLHQSTLSGAVWRQGIPQLSIDLGREAMEKGSTPFVLSGLSSRLPAEIRL